MEQLVNVKKNFLGHFVRLLDVITTARTEVYLLLTLIFNLKNVPVTVHREQQVKGANKPTALN